MEQPTKALLAPFVMAKVNPFVLSVMVLGNKSWLLATGFLCILFGFAIYALFRNTDSVLVFKLFDIHYGTLFEINSNFVKYNLPDFLWAIGFIALSERAYNSFRKNIVLLTWLIILEVTQLFGWGTFDYIDLMLIIVAFFIVNCKRIFWLFKRGQSIQI